MYSPDYFLYEINRVLGFGGCLILSTPNLFSLYNRNLFPFGIQPIFYEVTIVDASIRTEILKRIKIDKIPTGIIRLLHKVAIQDLLVSNGFTVEYIIGSIFERFSGVFKKIDSFLKLFPSFTSILVIQAFKRNIKY